MGRASPAGAANAGLVFRYKNRGLAAPAPPDAPLDRLPAGTFVPTGREAIASHVGFQLFFTRSRAAYRFLCATIARGICAKSLTVRRTFRFPFSSRAVTASAWPIPIS